MLSLSLSFELKLADKCRRFSLLSFNAHFALSCDTRNTIDIIPANSFTRRWTPGEINDYIMF